MKNYQKPQATITTVTNSNQMANSGLSGWLADTGMSNSNITTVEMFAAES